jgi:hypothetical protein
MNHDELLDLAVFKFGLDKRTRKQEVVDMRQYLSIWWYRNFSEFTTYDTQTKLGERFNGDHTLIYHYLNSRKKSRVYKQSVKPVEELLKLKFESR